LIRDRALRVHTHAQRSVKLLIFLHQNSKLKNNFTGKLCLKVSSWKLSGLRYEFGLFTPRKSIKHCGFHSELKLLEFQVSLIRKLTDSRQCLRHNGQQLENLQPIFQIN
jgi:hypothetical protein